MGKTINVLTEKQCSELIEFLKPDMDDSYVPRKQLRNYTMVLMMLDAGLRVGEVSKLTRGCVMFAGEFCDKVVIPESISKTKVERTIPMTNRLQEAIKKMHDRIWLIDNCQGNEFAFYSRHHKRFLSRRQIQRIVYYASLEALGFGINPHMLRHTFATRLMSRTNIRIVQELLGHVSIQSTQVYTHPNGQDLKKAIESLEH